MEEDDDMMQYGRVNFPEGVELKPGLREKWQGKIVGAYEGWWSSLEGRQDEGIFLSCKDEYIARLNEHELNVAKLLEQTFWNRTSYTEDVAVLEKLPKGHVIVGDIKCEE
jgi:hypothetical protein